MVYPDSHVRVVLMHDAVGKDLTVKTLSKIIAYYRSNGYKFGILSSRVCRSLIEIHI